jgi:hypothetical protein
MTEKLICSAIEKYVTSHEGVTDFPITYAQIMDEVDTLRIRTIQQMDSSLILRAPYNNIMQVLTFEDADFKTEPSTNRVYVECPRIFSHNTGDLAIAFVGSTNLNKQYRVVVGRQVKNARHDRWSQNDPIAHFDDTRLYLEKVARGRFEVHAIYERPRDLERWGYDPTKSVYPLSNGQIDEIIGKTAESYIRTLYRLRPQPNQMVDLPIPPQNA